VNALPGDKSLLARSRQENFPVAMRLLGPRRRAHLLAVYGVARVIDEAGDAFEGDRSAALEALEAELARAFAGEATHPAFVRLSETVRELALPREPFLRLLEANRRDQVVRRYERFDDLLGYCALSANPVGELVLRIFGAWTPERAQLSDRICSALQVIEHLQDVREDAARGRVYLPAEELVRFGVREEELFAPVASPALRRLVAYEAARATRLLEAGLPLVASLRGRARVAVAGFAGGGLAQLEAFERAGYDVLATRVRAPRRAVARRTWEVLLGSTGTSLGRGRVRAGGVAGVVEP